MEPLSSTLIPIASLDASQNAFPPRSQSIRGQITLSWPYSSSTKSCAFLVVDRDFRLRSKKGQVRVRFSGPSASAVARAKIEIGDEVVLQLEGARWVEEDAVMAQRTPGRSVGVELEFGGRLGLKIVRDAGEVEVLVDEPEAPVASADDLQEDMVEMNKFATPAPKVIANLREEGTMDAGMHIYSSPAFAKRLRLSGEHFLDSAYDPFADEGLDVDRVRKRQRLSFGGQWRYAKSESPTKSRSPSPTPAMDETVVEEPVVEQQTAPEEQNQGKPQEDPVSDATMSDTRMLPPAAPALQISSSPVALPSTPEMRPLPSDVLPLPSPFPDDSRQSWLVDPTDISTSLNVEEDVKGSADVHVTEPLVQDSQLEGEIGQAGQTPQEEDMMELEPATIEKDVEQIVSVESPFQPAKEPESKSEYPPGLVQPEGLISLPSTPPRTSRRGIGGLDGKFSSPALHTSTQSERDKIMKQTIQSLFGFQKSPEPQEVPKEMREESPSPDFQFNEADEKDATRDHIGDVAGIDMDMAISELTGLQPLQSQIGIAIEGFGFDQDLHQHPMPNEPAKATLVEVIDLDLDPLDEDPSTTEYEECVANHSIQASDVVEVSVEGSTLLDEGMASRGMKTEEPELEEEVRSQMSTSEEYDSDEDVPAGDLEMIDEERPESDSELEVHSDHVMATEVKGILPSQDASHEVAIFGQPVEELRPKPDEIAVEDAEQDKEFAREARIEETAAAEDLETDTQMKSNISHVTVIEDLINKPELQTESSKSQSLFGHMPAEQQTSEIQPTRDSSLSQSHPAELSTLHGTTSQIQSTSQKASTNEPVAEAIELASTVTEIAPSQVAARKSNASALEHFSSYHRSTEKTFNGSNAAIGDQKLSHEESVDEADAESQTSEHSADQPQLSAAINQVSYPNLPMTPVNSQSKEQNNFNLRNRHPAAQIPVTIPLTPQASDLKMPESSANEIEMPESSATESKVALRRSARKSFAARLIHVPDTVAQWFSPKNNAKTKPAEPTQAVKAIRTSKGYFTPLSQIECHLNLSGSQAAGNGVDVLAVVTNKPKLPSRAKRGPRDFFTVLQMRDQSSPSGEDVKVEIYRPWKASLPAAEVGDVVLLRQFGVKSRERRPYLLSNDASAWCVWRFSGAGLIAEDDEESDATKYLQGLSHGIILGDKIVREEIKGPPVELDDEERRHAKELYNWWLKTVGSETSHE